VCGIAGSFGSIATFSVSDALGRIAHSGPDGHGIRSDGPMTHGHVRLAILDTTESAAQPFCHGNSVLAFNGEIWNYKAIRSELEALGCIFKSSGDTEVLAQALTVWGWQKTLPKLEGMFAFSWSDGKDFILARDRFGKIPFYVCKLRNNRFVWSSERKGLGKLFPATPLPPGTVLDLTTSKMYLWYSLPPVVNGVAEIPVQTLITQLRDGVRARLISDAPLCCLISGGLDSSLILTLAKQENPNIVAYTAVHSTNSKDYLAAKRLCRELNVPLQEVRVHLKSEDFIAAAKAIEIPSKAQIEIAALCIPLARAIAADGFKVCLSGEAADELFGGYGSLCIKGSQTDDNGWRQLRIAQLAKMARGNFVRCNKAFMAAGVECRLPFMERQLVEFVLGLGKLACPPGKKALKKASIGVIPDWVIKRQKETFQGAAGADESAASLFANPRAFYRAEIIKTHGLAAV